MKNIYIIFIATCMMFPIKSFSAFQVTSPDGKLTVTIDSTGGQLTYLASRNGELLIGTSALSIIDNQALQVLSTQESSQDTTWKPGWGQFSEIRDHHHEWSGEILYGNGASGRLICRVFNNGFGFRFVLEPQAGVNDLQYKFDFNLSGSALGYISNGEKEPRGPLTITPGRNWPMPVVIELDNGTFMALMESDLYSANTFNKTMTMQSALGSSLLTSTVSGSLKNTGETITPWRVVKVGDSFGDLLTNNIALNLAAENQIEDPSWIKPGKFTWDWRVQGHVAPDDFVYGSNDTSFYRFIDFNSENGIPYFMIDDGWWDPNNVTITDVIAYGKSKGVEIILYYDHKYPGEPTDQEVVDIYEELDVAGIKWGFRGNDPQFTRKALDMLAKAKKISSFHDSPTPMIGTSRTMPNATTREFCHAQLDRRTAFTPTSFLKMAMVNALTGPLDQVNGYFAIEEVNQGTRDRGVSKPNTFHTTIVSEIARVLIVYSPLLGLPDAPDVYAARPDLFEFLREMPATWDETLILNSQWAEYITTARRSGRDWFIGSVINEDGGVLDISLPFLEEGVPHLATFYEDTDSTHYINNPESYQVRQDTVYKGDLIKASLALGGGHAMWIRPLLDPSNISEPNLLRHSIDIHYDPANKIISINVPKATSFKVEIHNVSGVLVHSFQENYNKAYVRADHLKQGLYIISVSSQDVYIIGKITAILTALRKTEHYL